MSDYERLQVMVSRLAHEIRNPLATIKSGIQLFLRRITPPAELAAYLTDAIAATDRIATIIERMRLLLSLSPRTGSIFPVNRLLQALQQQYSDEPRLVFELGAETKIPKVFVNFDQLVLALSELIDNALRFSEEDVTVSWRIGLPEEIVIGVVDKGPGLPGEIESRLFEPFVAGPHRGVGLGLAIVARVCELNQAKPSARNLVDGGSELAIHLRAI